MSASGARLTLRAAMLPPRLTSLLTSSCGTDIGTRYGDYVHSTRRRLHSPHRRLHSPHRRLHSFRQRLPSILVVDDRVACSGDLFPFVRPEGVSPLRTGGCGTDDGASTDGSDPCAHCAPFRCLCVARWTPSSSASSGTPLCGLWAHPTGQEDVGASGSPAAGRQRYCSGISPPLRRPCSAGSVLARRFGELPAAVQAPSSLAPLGPAVVTPPGTLLGVEEVGSPPASVVSPIPGSLAMGATRSQSRCRRAPITSARASPPGWGLWSRSPVGSS